MMNTLFIRSAVASAGLCLGLTAAPAFSQEPTLQEVLEVGKLPSVMLHYQDEVHVFCSRLDQNFDGVQDEGDVPASWHVIDVESNRVVRSKEFSWEDGYYFDSNVSIDSVAGLFYVPLEGRVAAFSPSSLEEVRGEYNLGGSVLTAMAVLPEDELAVYTFSPSFDEPGYALLTTRVPVGIAPKKVEFYDLSNGGEGYWVMSEGAFGAGNGDVHLINSLGGVTRIEVGNLPNDAFRRGDSLFVVVNGDDVVHIIDLQREEIVSTIEVGSGSGFGFGARTGLVSGDTLYVAAWGTDDVRLFSISSGEFLSSIEQEGKPAALAKAGDKLFVARQYESGGFSADNAVLVWKLVTVSVVQSPSGEEAVVRLSAAPMPATERIRVHLSTQQASAAAAIFTLHTIQGEQMASVPAAIDGKGIAGEFDIVRLGCASGVYLVRCQIGKEVFSMPIQIVR